MEDPGSKTGSQQVHRSLARCSITSILLSRISAELTGLISVTPNYIYKQNTLKYRKCLWNYSGVGVGCFCSVSLAKL